MECISLCAWHFLFVYFVSQCAFSEPSLHQLDLLFRNLLWRLYPLWMTVTHCMASLSEFMCSHAHNNSVKNYITADGLIDSWLEWAWGSLTLVRFVINPFTELSIYVRRNHNTKGLSTLELDSSQFANRCCGLWVEYLSATAKSHTTASTLASPPWYVFSIAACIKHNY